MGPARLHKILGHPVLRRQTEKKILHLQIALTIPGVLYLFVMTGKLAHSPTFSVSFPLINAYKTVTYMQRLESVKWQPSHTLLKHLFSITFCSVVSNRIRPSDSKGRQQLSSRISFRKHKEIKTYTQATHTHTHELASTYNGVLSPQTNATSANAHTLGNPTDVVRCQPILKQTVRKYYITISPQKEQRIICLVKIQGKN